MTAAECTCFPVANPWTYNGIVEPGGAWEPNPECPEHFPSVPDTTNHQEAPR